MTRRLPRPLSPQQVALALADTKDRDPMTHLLVAILYDTGLRDAEACAVRWVDVSLEDKTIRVKGKGGKDRLVLFGEPLARLLRAHYGRSVNGEAATSDGSSRQQGSPFPVSPGLPEDHTWGGNGPDSAPKRTPGPARSARFTLHGHSPLVDIAYQPVLAFVNERGPNKGQYPADPRQHARWRLKKLGERLGPWEWVTRKDGTVVRRNVLHPHALRHSFATHMIVKNGAPLTAVMDLLGHRDVRSTEVYLHADVGEELRQSLVDGLTRGITRECLKTTITSAGAGLTWR